MSGEEGRHAATYDELVSEISRELRELKVIETDVSSLMPARGAGGICKICNIYVGDQGFLRAVLPLISDCAHEESIYICADRPACRARFTEAREKLLALVKL